MHPLLPVPYRTPTSISRRDIRLAELGKPNRSTFRPLRSAFLRAGSVAAKRAPGAQAFGGADIGAPMSPARESIRCRTQYPERPPFDVATQQGVLAGVACADAGTTVEVACGTDIPLRGQGRYLRSSSVLSEYSSGGGIHADRGRPRVESTAADPPAPQTRPGTRPVPSPGRRDE